MEFFKTNTKIDFLGLRVWAAVFSALLFVFSILALTIHGLNFGLDFTGGTQIQVSFVQPANIPQIRDNLIKAGLNNTQVQSYGDSHDALISLSVDEKQNKVEINQKQLQQQLVNRILSAIPNAKFKRADFIGAKVSSELAYKGILAVVVALLITMIYIAFRFEVRLAIGAAIALVHDPILILGIFSFFHIEFDLVTLAAILTIIGYSLNDTIVVFDRVRENFRKMRRSSSMEIMNVSINQTLSRTIIASGLTLLVVLALFFLGGPSIHAFALALIIGIVVGTYSSIYVAGSLAVVLGLRRSNLLSAKKDGYDAP